MKIISWNVNGIRAWYKKECLGWVLSQKPDIFCIQETKAEKIQLPDELANVGGYYSYFSHSMERKGHSGTAIYTKIEPEQVTYGLGVDKFDKQGRQINLFYKDVVIINCYFPNGGGPADRLKFKLDYYEEFLKFINKLRKSGKEVIFCGDINVAHQEIDLARPDANKDNVGFLPIERAWVDKVIENNFIDIYRYLYPKDITYSWWDMKTRARDRNIGWRIDSFFVDKSLINKVKRTKIHDDVLGSDHAPVELDIEIKL